MNKFINKQSIKKCIISQYSCIGTLMSGYNMCPYCNSIIPPESTVNTDSLINKIPEALLNNNIKYHTPIHNLPGRRTMPHDIRIRDHVDRYYK